MQSYSHLKHNCQFTFEGPYRLTGEPAPFYGAALLCQLVLPAGCSYKSARKTKELDTPATFYFLFRTVDDDEVLIPLTGGEGDILLAKRWLGLSLRDDADRLDYARFYCGFALTGKPPWFSQHPAQRSRAPLREVGPKKSRFGASTARCGVSLPTRGRWTCASTSSRADRSGVHAIALICPYSSEPICSTSTSKSGIATGTSPTTRRG